MVRTGARTVVTGGKGSGKKGGNNGGSSSSAGSSTSKSNPSSGGNRVCPRETPAWQKPITSFYGKKSEESVGSDDSEKLLILFESSYPNENTDSSIATIASEEATDSINKEATDYIIEEPTDSINEETNDSINEETTDSINEETTDYIIEEPTDSINEGASSFKVYCNGTEIPDDEMDLVNGNYFIRSNTDPFENPKPGTSNRDADVVLPVPTKQLDLVNGNDFVRSNTEPFETTKRGADVVSLAQTKKLKLNENEFKENLGSAGPSQPSTYKGEEKRKHVNILKPRFRQRDSDN